MVSEIYVYGDVLVEQVDQCTCFGGFDVYGHEPSCGLEPVAFVDEWSATILWDMSDIWRGSVP